MQVDSNSTIELLVTLQSVQAQLNHDAMLMMSYTDLPPADYFEIEFPQLNLRLPLIQCQDQRMTAYFSACIHPLTILDRLIPGSSHHCRIWPVDKHSESGSSGTCWQVLSDVAGLGYALGFMRRKKSSGQLRYYLLDADEELPVRLMPSSFLVNSVPPWVTATLPLLEDWGIVARIAAQNRAGCYEDDYLEMVHKMAVENDIPCLTFAAGKREWLDKMDFKPDSAIVVN